MYKWEWKKPPMVPSFNYLLIFFHIFSGLYLQIYIKQSQKDTFAFFLNDRISSFLISISSSIILKAISYECATSFPQIILILRDSFACISHSLIWIPQDGTTVDLWTMLALGALTLPRNPCSQKLSITFDSPKT